MSARKKSGAAAGLTNAIGGMLVGLDEQLLRAQPRIEVLVKRRSRDQLRGERDAAGELVIELPVRSAEDPEPPSEGARDPA